MRSGGQQRRGEVAQRGEVLGQGARHRLDDRVTRGLERAHRPRPVIGCAPTSVATPPDGAQHDPVTKRRVGVGMVGAGVGAAALGAQDAPPTSRRSGHLDQVGQLGDRRLRARRRRQPRERGRSTSTPSWPCSDAASRSTPAPSVIARCRRTRAAVARPRSRRPPPARPARRQRRARRPSGAGAQPDASTPPITGRTVRSSSAGPRRRVGRAPSRMAPVAQRRGAARLDRLDHPGPEHHALEQRVRGQPVGAVHPGAGDLARGPQARGARRPRRGR